MKIVTRQQFGAALLEPVLDRVPVTGRAVPVAAGVIDLHLLAAPLTLVHMSAVGLRSALLDVQEGLWVRTRHAAREPLQVGRPEPTHDLGQFDCPHRPFQTGRVMIFSIALRT